MRRSHNETIYAALAFVAASLSAFRFLLPAFATTHGEWSAPLDDAFIHFDFARAAASGHPFSWIGGQGFSSGETSPLYATLLTIGYAIGFRNAWISVWATALAIASVASMMVSARQVGRTSPSLLIPIFFVSVGFVDVFYWSGMEIALFGALFGRALVWLDRSRRLRWNVRAQSKALWRLGMVCMLLVWVRPEAAVCVYAFAIFAARGVNDRPFLSLFKTAAPAAFAVLAVLALNRLFSDSAASAGARLKLLSSNPFLSDADRAREFALNLGHFVALVLARAFTFRYGVLLLLALAALGLIGKKRRSLIATALLCAFLFALLVSWNGAARYQHLRYYAPVVMMLLFAAAIGAANAKKKHRRFSAAALGVLSLLGFVQVPEQARFFTRAWSNIYDQQVATGKYLASHTPPNAIVLIGDAGAIPYLSQRNAIDALGLGAYHRVPFTKAAPHGEGAMLELIERLLPSMRPTHMALFPNWFPETTRLFGRELARFALNDNVITGGQTKVAYVADFSSMRPESFESTDEIDVADVVSEEEHAYLSPAPHGGFTRAVVRAVSSGEPTFDGCRVTPQGEHESFVAKANGTKVRVRLAQPVHALVASSASNPAPTFFSFGSDGEWTIAEADLAVRKGERITVTPEGELVDCHVWIR